MLNTTSVIQYQNGAAGVVMPRIAVGDAHVRQADSRAYLPAAEAAVDEILAESFPASDPPSWNSGTAHLGPGRALHDGRHGGTAAETGRSRVSKNDVVVQGSRQVGVETPLVDILKSTAGATGIVLLVPVAILLVGLPIALSIRGVVEALGWLFAFASS